MGLPHASHGVDLALMFEMTLGISRVLSNNRMRARRCCWSWISFIVTVPLRTQCRYRLPYMTVDEGSSSDNQSAPDGSFRESLMNDSETGSLPWTSYPARL